MQTAPTTHPQLIQLERVKIATRCASMERLKIRLVMQAIKISQQLYVNLLFASPDLPGRSTVLPR